MNGEPFCYATRLTVRNLLEMRANGLTPAEMMARSPELRRVGIAEAFRTPPRTAARYADFFEKDGSLRGPGFTRRRGGGAARAPARRCAEWSSPRRRAALLAIETEC